MSKADKSAAAAKKILFDFHAFWQKGSYAQAKAALEPALQAKRPPAAITWLKCCALIKQGFTAQALDEMMVAKTSRGDNSASLPGNLKPGNLFAFIGFDGSQQDVNTVFALTLNDAPEELCTGFIDLLDAAKLPPLCGRLAALNPAKALAYADQAARRIIQAINGLTPIIEFNKQSLQINPNAFEHLLKILDALMTYEAALLAKEQIERLVKPEGTFESANAQMRDALKSAFADILDPQYESRGGFDPLHQVVTLLNEILAAGSTVTRAVSLLMPVGAKKITNLGAAAAKGPPDYIMDFFHELMNLGVAASLMKMATLKPSPFIRISDEEQTGINRRFVGKVRRQIDALGYRFVCLFRQDCLKNLGPNMTPALFIDPKNHTNLTAFATRAKWASLVEFVICFLTGHLWVKRHLRLTTLLTNGRIVYTWRTSSPPPWDEAPQFYIEIVSRWTSISKLVARHSQRVDEILAASPGVGIVPMATLDDAEKTELLSTRYGQEFRKSINYVTQDELKRVLKGRYKKMGPPITDKLSKIAELLML